MFFGHFVFERNIPTILKQPSTPFVIAWSVIQASWSVWQRAPANPLMKPFMARRMMP